MKKFLLLLLIPLSISAKADITANIECANEFSINSKVNCNLLINNPSQVEIQTISFSKNDMLLDLKSDFKLTLENETYNVNLNTNESVIKLLNFNYFMKKNNADIVIENIAINVDDEPINKNAVKILKIEDIAYIDNIYINNQPINEINQDIFDYSVNLYERTDYIEVKVITSGKNRLLDENIKLIKFVPNSTLTLRVTNDIDTETYNIKFNYKVDNDVREIKIEEIPFVFNPNKKYYYLEVENNISKITIDNSIYNLNIGKNKIDINNNNEIYSFVINRLKRNDTINTDTSLKTLKIGNYFINLKNDVYEYNHVANKVDLVTVDLNNSQDYSIKYNYDKVTISVYDGNANKSEYVLNIISDDDKTEYHEYDKTKMVIIFIMFLLLFLLIFIAVIRKHKKERIN